MRAQMSLGSELGAETHCVENTIFSTLDLENFIHSFIALTAKIRKSVDQVVDRAEKRNCVSSEITAHTHHEPVSEQSVNRQ